MIAKVLDERLLGDVLRGAPAGEGPAASASGRADDPPPAPRSVDGGGEECGADGAEAIM